MKGWNICDQDLLIAQYESEYYEHNTGIRTALPYDFGMHQERTQKRSIRKASEKTSLKSNRNTQKGSQNVIIGTEVRQPLPQTQLIKHASTNSNIYLQHPQQRRQMVKLVCPKPHAIQHKASVSEAYTMSPPSSPGIGAKVAKNNVQINYVNYCKPVANPEIIYPRTCQPPVIRTLKRMNTAPTLVPFVQPIEHTVMQNKDILTKSVDYENDKQLLKSLKSTQNLNQIKCVKTESIPDPDQYQDEYSIVVSPLEEDNFSNQRFDSEVWAEYMLEGNSTANSHVFTNLIELKEA